jgi:hypothetical protein
MDINRIVVEGQDAVVLGRATFVVRATGKLIDTMFAVHIVVDDDGRINRFVMGQCITSCVRQLWAISIERHCGETQIDNTAAHPQPRQPDPIERTAPLHAG